MKANELMPGDLITFKDCQNDKEIIVIKIWQINQEGNALVFIDDSKVLDEVTIDEELAGIPLTPEILEKNGFKYNPFGTGFYECKTEDGNIACTKTDYWLFYINDNIIPNHFHYVHELQHALKLCGIEKNIII